MATQLANESLLRVVPALGLALLVLGSTSEARGEGRPAYGEQVIGSLVEAPNKADPVHARSHSDVAIARLLFDTLYECEGKRLVPKIAAGPPVLLSDLPHQWEIPVRSRLQFQDGRRLQASDVARSLKRVMAQDKRFFLREVKDVQASATSVIIELVQPDKQFPRRLCDVRTSITPEGKAPTWEKLVGSGPFRVAKKTDKKRELVLQANNDYFAGRPYAEKITLRWSTDPSAEARVYERGGSHFSLRGAIAFAGHKPKYRTAIWESAPRLLTFVGFGSEIELLSEIRFRRAISELVPRKGMQQIGTGERIVPTRLPIATISRIARSSPRKAKDLLRSLHAKYPELQARSLRIQVMVNRTRPDDAQVAARVVAALHNTGILAVVQPVGALEFAQRVENGKCQLYIDQSVLAERDEDNWLMALGQTKGGAPPPVGNTLLRARFATQTPIVPLFLRALRVHYRAEIQGLSLDGGEMLQLERVYSAGGSDNNP